MNDSGHVDSDTDAATPFQGDAFGTAEDYASDTFGQATNNNEVEADNPPPLMEVSDDEDDDEEDDEEEELEMAAMVAELEKSWEPPREGAPRQDATVADDDAPPLMDVSDDEDNDEENDSEEEAPRQQVDDSDIDDDEGHAQHKRNVDRFIIGDGYGVKPAIRIRYNDKYTSARAGQPLTHQEARDYVYGTALGGGDNPWAPFNSKKDWEIARWAKLRGAGSTAFLELLAINGVCLSSSFYGYNTHTCLFNRYMRPSTCRTRTQLNSTESSTISCLDGPNSNVRRSYRVVKSWSFTHAISSSVFALCGATRISRVTLFLSPNDFTQIKT